MAKEWTCYQWRGSDLALVLARVQKGMRDGTAREWRGSQAAMLMHLARVQIGVAKGARLWSGRRDGAAGLAREWRWRWRRWLFALLCGHHITTNGLVWNRWRGKPIFHVKGKRETSNFRCVLVGLLGVVRNQIFGWADRQVYSAKTEIYSMF